MKKCMPIWGLAVILLASCAKENPVLPSLQSPVNDFVGAVPSEGLYFEWSGVAGAEEYYFQLSNAEDFSFLVLTDTVMSNAILINTISLSPNTTYYWRVRALNLFNYSSEWSFSTTAVAPCPVCGDYQGTGDGNVGIPAFGSDSTFVGVGISINVKQNPSETYNVSLDVSSFLGSPVGTLVPNFNGVLSGSTLTVTDQLYNYSGIATIGIDGTMNFPTANTSTGNFTFSEDLMGEITFSGTK